MRKLLPILLLCISFSAFAQFPIGHRTITYNDPARSNRAIACEVYYPGASAGNNVAVATGEFPVVVMGHGFSMAVTAYQNWWEEFVPDGYIFVLPTTEGSLLPAPSHGAFGLDLAFMASKMQAANGDNASPFFEKVKPRTALMGHSMGGGATILAAANNTSIDCIVAMAPAETTPSAVTAGANVSVPALLLYGTEDQVVPEASHSLLIYNGLGSSCKYYARLDEGAHCFYANYNIFCATGEMNIGTLTREQQQALSYTIVGPWLAYFLKDLCPSYDEFTTEFTTNSGLGPNLESCADDAPIIVDNGGTLESDAQINYQWYLNGIEIPNADQQTYAYTQSGTYQVASQVLGNCPSFSNEIMVQITGIVEADLLLLRNSGRTRISTNHELNNLTIEWIDLSGRMLDASSLPFVAKNGAIPVTEPDFMGVKLLRIRSNETVRTWKMW